MCFPQGLKPPAEKRGFYRSAKALRHPKASCTGRAARDYKPAFIQQLSKGVHRARCWRTKHDTGGPPTRCGQAQGPSTRVGMTELRGMGGGTAEAVPSRLLRQGLKPPAEKGGFYRSAKALRHPKARAVAPTGRLGITSQHSSN